MSSYVLPVWLMLLSAEYGNNDRFKYVADRVQHLVLTYNVWFFKRECTFDNTAASVDISRHFQPLLIAFTMAETDVDWFVVWINWSSAVIPKLRSTFLPFFLLTMQRLICYTFRRTHGTWDCSIVMLDNRETRTHLKPMIPEFERSQTAQTLKKDKILFMQRKLK